MNCNDVQTKIIEASGSLPTEVQTHLRECEACREFAEAHRHVLAAMQACDPPPELDEKVLQAGKALLREQGAARDDNVRKMDAPLNFSRERVPRRAAFQWQWLAAACVALGFTLLLTFLLNSGSLVSEKRILAVRTQTPQATADQEEPHAWKDSDLELELLSLETELAFTAEGDTIVTESSGGTEETVPGGGTSMRSVDDALLEIELNLLLDSQKWLDSSARGGA